MKKSHLKLDRSVRRPQGRQSAVTQAAAYRRWDTVPDHYSTLWGANNPRTGAECDLVRFPHALWCQYIDKAFCNFFWQHAV